MIDVGWLETGEPDRRSAIRRRALRKALVVSNSGWCTQNAEILNMSADGALIRLDGIGTVPETFELRYFDRKKLVNRVSSKGLKIGVSFEF